MRWCGVAFIRRRRPGGRRWGVAGVSEDSAGTITHVRLRIMRPTTRHSGYEITQPKFVDWSPKPVRIPALLRRLHAGCAGEGKRRENGVGTPIGVQPRLTLKLPDGETVRTPAANAVARD